MGALRAHIDAVNQHHLLGTGIDFKLASSSGPSSSQAARETGFQSLTVSLCQVSSATTISITYNVVRETVSRYIQNLNIIPLIGSL